MPPGSFRTTNGSLLCSPRFEVKTASFFNLTILLREPTDQPGIWKVTGCILADKATYDPQTGQWDLTHGRMGGSVRHRRDRSVAIRTRPPTCCPRTSP